MPSREKKEQQKETRRLMDTAASHYNRGWYKKAKDLLLRIDDDTLDSQLYQDTLLRTYRKLTAYYVEKEQYTDALAEMKEMFETCTNTTNSDDKKFNNLLEILNQSGSLLDIPKREPGTTPSEFSGRTGSLTCCLQAKHPADFKLPGGHAIDALKLLSISHLLPSNFPYLDLEENEDCAVQYRFFQPPNDRLDHDLDRFNASPSGFITLSEQSLIIIYDWYLQEQVRFNTDSLIGETSVIKCIDVAPDFSCFLFTLNRKLFLVDSSNASPVPLFSWEVSKDIDHSLSTMFGGQHKSTSIRVTGTGFSQDGKIFYVGCSNGGVYRMDRQGRIDRIYILPANLRYVHSGRLTVKHIVELTHFIHIYAENEILVIQRGSQEKLIRVIKVNDGEIKWFDSGFVHLVYHDVYLYGADGLLTDVLQFRQKPRFLCVSSQPTGSQLLVVDCDDKLYAFRMPSPPDNQSKSPLSFDPDANEFSPVQASGVQPVVVDEQNSDKSEENIELSPDDFALAESRLNPRTPVSHYFRLARSSGEHLADKDFVRRVLTAAEQVMPDSVFNKVKLAQLVAQLLDDSQWVERLHRSALALLRNNAEFRALSFSIIRFGPGKQEASAILLEQLEHSPSAAHYIERARIIAEVLDQPELAVQAQEIVKQRFMPLSRLEDLFQTCQIELEELADAGKIAHIQAFIQKYSQCRNIAPILFRAVSLLQPLDTLTSLLTYVRYYQMAAAQPDSLKPLPLKIKNRVFENQEQAQAFEAILQDINPEDDWAGIEQKIKRIFIPRHKPIHLDTQRIHTVTRQHQGTVQTLGQVLSSSEDDLVQPTAIQPRVQSGLDAIFASPVPSSENDTVESLPFNPVQRQFLTLLAAHDGLISESAVSQFTRDHKLFKNQLIDGINQLFYDSFQDLLLEETPQGIAINPDYLDFVQAL